MKTLESIITSPLVEKSRESSIPSWLMLPMAGCLVCGILFTYSPSSILNLQYQSVRNLQWVAPIFMIAGGTFSLTSHHFCKSPLQCLKATPFFIVFRDVFHSCPVGVVALDVPHQTNIPQAQQIDRNLCIYIDFMYLDNNYGDDIRIQHFGIVFLGW